VFQIPVATGFSKLVNSQSVSSTFEPFLLKNLQTHPNNIFSQREIISVIFTLAFITSNISCMSITNLLWFLVPVLVLQIVMFFVIRQKKKNMKRDDILVKYDISSRGDLFRMLQNPDLADDDRAKLQALYEKGFQDE